MTIALVITTSASCLWTASAAPLSIYYTLPRDARVSILIQDAGGTVVRELLHAAPRKKGANSEA